MKYFKESDTREFYFVDLYKTGQTRPYYKYRYQIAFLGFGLLFGRNPEYKKEYA